MTLCEVYAARADNRRRLRSATPTVREIRLKMAVLYNELIDALKREGKVAPPAPTT